MIHAGLTMRSVVLDMDTKVDVLIPEDRHETTDTRGKKYPVLYVLHGGKEDNSSWLHLSNIFLMCRDLDLVVVMPTTYRGAYADAVYGQKYFTWIADELPVKIKNIFPMISDRREDTFVMGESMGGGGTFRLAMRRPENFGKAVVLSAGNRNPFADKRSGALDIGLYGSEEQWLASDENADNLIEKMKTYEGHKPDMVFYCGTEDFAYPGCKELYEKLKAECPDMNVKGEFWTGKHNFFFWNQAIPKALKEFGFTIVENQTV